MASISEIIKVNETLPSRYESATAVFTGATQGVGLGTLQAFVKHIPKPRAIIVGRSRERFEDEMNRLRSINSSGEFIFIEGELSLIKDVDAIYEQIKQYLAGTKVDLLCMSQGYAPLEGRDYTSEGLDSLLVLVYYGRMRMVQQLIDGQLMASNGTVVSLLAGTIEGNIFEDDLALERNYSILRLRAQFASLTSVSLAGLAADHPEMSFKHIFPGRVKTGLLSRSVKSTVFWILLAYIVEPIIFLGGITSAECGERMLWMALGERHAKGFWSLDDAARESQSAELTRYRQNSPLLAQIRADIQQVFDQAIATHS
jgi:hypothetical protein